MQKIVKVDQEVHHQLKIEAVKNSMTMSQFIQKLLENYNEEQNNEQRD